MQPRADAQIVVHEAACYLGSLPTNKNIVIPMAVAEQNE